MRGRFRLPMFVVAAALLGLIVLLATLQYRWLGQISNAERERMKSTLNTRASGFAQDFDSELTRAYLLFQVEQVEQVQDGQSLASRVAARYDRWQATARYPRMLKDLYLVSGGPDTGTPVQRFNAATRFIEPAEWPESMSEIRAHLSAPVPPQPPGSLVVRTMPGALWEAVPAVVVPRPILFFNERAGNPELHLPARMSYTVLVLDRDYMTAEMLPALAQQHFRGAGDGFDYQLAVVSAAGQGVVYHSTDVFSPKPDAKVDAAVDLFQVRMQDFGAIAAEVRRFATTFTTAIPRGGRASGGTFVHRETIPGIMTMPPETGRVAIREGMSITGPDGKPVEIPSREGSREGRPISIIVQQGGTPNSAAFSSGVAAGSSRAATHGPARWRLLVKHPSGSLEAAVNSARRRNILVSTSILAILGASVGLLILSTRRAQELARQQMEFVAAVSHELRTPLSVIRSAGDNLADGVVRDDEQIRRYGDLVRNEGRRLTEMVEQILEFAGIQSGQRGFALRPVAVLPLIRGIVESSAPLIEAAGLQVEYDIPDSVPPVLGDEAALRRVFQNLIDNAVKYGAGGGWIGIKARQTGREVLVSVADRGIGIVAAEQRRIFEPFYRTPDVIAAQIQGAGLGLSLVKRIAEAHGGRIAVTSAPGAGSEFTVVLPAASEEAAEPVGRSALSEAAGNGSQA